MQDVVVVSGVRTAIGDFGGSLKDVPPVDLGSAVIGEAARRADLDPAHIQHAVMGNVIHTEPRDMYLARVAALGAGVPAAAPALTVNRLCGSGLQAIISAAQMIRLAECDIAVAGGAESMSRALHATPSMRWGRRMGEPVFYDMMLGALHDPFGHGHMGITGENVAAQHQVERASQDALAVESHRRAAHAAASGYFDSQIMTLEVKAGRKTRPFATDEHVRTDIDAAEVSGLRPAFREGGTVTVANSSGINDGAAAVILMSAGEARRRGLQPMASIRGWGHAGVDPAVMGLGPVKAVPIALKRAGISVEQLDVIESNEAFAAQACAVSRELGFPAERTNPNGGAIALGHPIGATGAILTVKALYELQRTNGRYGLMTMCIGGGQGIAMVIQRH